MKTKSFLATGIASLFAVMLISVYAAKAPTSVEPETNADYMGVNTIDGPTPTPSCPPGWSAGPPMPPPSVVRAVGAYFPANGRFYAMGGRSADVAGADFTNPFEYNPATNTWATKTAAYPDNKVNNMACAVLSVGGTDQIYCVGGNASAVVGNATRVFSYNPVTDAMTVLTAADDWPGATAGAFLPGGFAVAANKLYIIGSFDANAVPPVTTAQVWQFDPNAAVGARWLARTPLPVPRAYVPAATIGGLIYTGGGSNLDVAGVLIDAAESFKYDPVTGIWTAIANIPRATGETRAVVMNNQMWVLGGGRVAPNPGAQVDIYDPVSNTWSAGPPMSIGRRNFPADSDGTTRIWLAGGYDSNVVLSNTMEIFGPGTCPPTPTPTGTPSPTPGPTGTPGPTPTPGGSATPTPGGSVTPTATPGGSVTPTPTPNPGPAQALNLATRLLVQGGDSVGIGGFIITGTDPKEVLIRGIGPSLTGFGVPNALADPTLELNGPPPFTGVFNNNWKDTQQAAIKATGIPPTNDLESAILVTLDPGAYTAILRGAGDASGVALVEIYDLSPGAASKLANIATRAFVSTGNDIVIAGFILGNGVSDDRAVIRGIGPSLAEFGVPNVLANPTLSLRNSDGAVVRDNDDWEDDPSQAALLTLLNLAPTNPLESGIVEVLPPGAYTALLAGLNNGTGNALVEVYDNPVAGPTPTPGGTATPTPTPGGPTPTPGGTATPTPAPPCVEAFDGVSAPALPAGWVATNPDPGDGIMWVTTTTGPDTAPNAAFINDQDGVSDKVLDSRPITVNSATAQISFRNNFDTEFSDGVFWDGGVLEVSSPNISGGAFVDITDPQVGGSFVSGAYTGEISGDASNPLAGRMAWSGSSGGYIDSVINLGANVNGQTITLRWRMGTDEAVVAPGWWVDTISFTGASCQ